MKVQHPDFPSLVRDVGNPGPWFATGWIEVTRQVDGEGVLPELDVPAAKKTARKRAPKKRA